MKLDHFVPTPETCTKLKDAGFTTKTYFRWWHGISVEEWWLDPIKEVPKDQEIMTAPAPSLQELLRELHDTIFLPGDRPSQVSEHTAKLLVRVTLAPNPAEEAAQLWLESHARG